MRNMLIAFMFGVFLTGIPFSFLAVRVSGQQKTKVLAQKIVVTPASKPTPTPVPTLRPTPTPTPISQPVATPQQINGFIDRFAGQYGVDPNVLRHIAVCESGFRQFAENLGYAGLFQFGPITWANLRQEIGKDVNPDLRFNAEEAVQTAAYALSQGKKGIWPNCRP